MRRKSVKKSSMFKVQQDKATFKKYLDHVQTCATASSYPHLLDSIKRTSQTVYNYCYDFTDENPFTKGVNYGCKNYGLSFPTSNIMIIRQWVPNAKQVYLLGDFNQFNQESHPMVPVEDEKDIFMLELDMAKNHINDQSRILIKIVDTEGKVHTMPPPSCKIRSKSHAYVCVNNQLPSMKHLKKQDIIMAYTIDHTKVPLNQTLKFIEDHESFLHHFNTIILRSLFTSSTVIDKGTLNLQQMKCLRDIVNKVKNQMGLKIIIQWSLQPGALRHGLDNPIQKQLLKQQQQGLWQYDLQKQQVLALYLANLSYYLSVFQIDGYHMKRIDSFCKDELGQVLVKCLNIMNNRLHENGFTLASCKKQVPGLNQPILQGGLGFTFTYNYNENFLQCRDHNQLYQKFSKILTSSNCVAINLDELTVQHQLNFLFAVLVSGKGIFCKGNADQSKLKLLQKLFIIRRQPQLFNQTTMITKISQATLQVERGKTVILFNFGQSSVTENIHNIGQMQLINNFSRNQLQISGDQIRLQARSCCVLQR